MTSPVPKLNLPQLEKVKLHRFSLYTANPDAEFTCGNGVFCLVGANGIGKSTLLSAINYCLTGIVSEPNRTFKSMEEYYNFTRAFTSNYFRGRIHGSDEEDAEITIHFRLGEFYFEICRGLFEPDELRVLTITNRATNEVVLTSDAMSRSERNRAYVEFFVENSNVSTFEEFAFLQHFVFSFDEQRKTLFWNQPIMERVLYRAFGLEPDMAKQVDSIRREIDKWDSDVRNRQWDATRLRRRIHETQSKVQATPQAQQTYESLMADHKSLSEQFDHESKVLRELEIAIKDANLLLAEHSMRETVLRDEYANFFERSFNLRPPLSEHPLITQSISEQACGLCGSEEADALAAILRKSKKSTCPLCDSSLNQESKNEEDLSRLKEIDKELAEAKRLIRDVLQTLKGLNAEEAKVRLQWTATKDKLDEFNRQNNATLDGLRNLLNHGNATASLALYAEQLAAFEKEKNEAYEQREKLKQQLLNIQRNLEESYLRVEKEFVSKFAELAHQFLGMPLTVQLDARESSGPKLVVSVRGTTRREQQQLSESQRFFLDIALRMALTQHMADSNSPGGMFIDTPEGSLDISALYSSGLPDMVVA